MKQLSTILRAACSTTAAQERYLERVRAAGGVGIVAHSLDELRAGLAAAFGAAQLAAWDAMQKRGRR